MQFDLPFGLQNFWARKEAALRVGAQAVRLQFVRHRRARRYVLRLCPDGTARVTIPRGGSDAEAKRFAQSRAAWIERQLVRQAAQPVRPAFWGVGTEILFRGEDVRIETEAGATGRIRFANQALCVPDMAADLRPAIEGHLRQLAARELPARVAELSAAHKLNPQRVSVRNQRSRWGSCSRRGTISLNWRLVQTPIFVRDYIILHELAHLKEMNHSRRFWSEVARLCPDFEQAEKWLKTNSRILL